MALLGAARTRNEAVLEGISKVVAKADCRTLQDIGVSRVKNANAELLIVTSTGHDPLVAYFRGEGTNSGLGETIEEALVSAKHEEIKAWLEKELQSLQTSIQEARRALQELKEKEAHYANNKPKIDAEVVKDILDLHCKLASEATGEAFCYHDQDERSVEREIEIVLEKHRAFWKIFQDPDSDKAAFEEHPSEEPRIPAKVPQSPHTAGEDPCTLALMREGDYDAAQDLANHAASTNNLSLWLEAKARGQGGGRAGHYAVQLGQVLRCASLPARTPKAKWPRRFAFGVLHRILSLFPFLV